MEDAAVRDEEDAQKAYEDFVKETNAAVEAHCALSACSHPHSVCKQRHRARARPQVCKQRWPDVSRE